MIRSVISIASMTLIAGALLAPAAGATVLGPDSGVTATRNGDKLDIAFTPGALAGSMLKAGRTVDVNCNVVPPAAKLLLAEGDDSGQDDTAGYGDGTVGADGVAHITLTANVNDDKPGALDYCDVERVRHDNKTTSTVNTVARVSLTPAGATYVDETERASALRRLLKQAHTTAGYQPVAALGAGVVAMDKPDATPPAGQTGYWTDGTHAAVATLSAAGRHLLIQDMGGLVLRSNVFDEMDPLGFDDFDPSQLSTVSTSSSSQPAIPDADKKPSPYKSNNPLRPGDGVRATVSGRRATVQFSGKAAKTLRALRGRRVSVFCLPVPKLSLFPTLVDELLHPETADSGGIGVARVPARGGAVTATLKGGTGDVCFVSDDQKAFAIAGGTVAGKGWMQDLAALDLIDGSLGLAAPGAQSYRPTDMVVAAGRKKGLVAMSGPDGAVPVGKIGVWTDGAKQAAVAVVSPSGHRFMIADEGERMGRTNVLSLYSSLFFSVAITADTGDTSLSFFG